MKTNRIWSQRSEALSLLAGNPSLTAQELVEQLFNSPAATVSAEVEALRAKAEAAKTAAETPAETPVSQPVVDETASEAEKLAAAVDARLSQ